MQEGAPWASVTRTAVRGCAVKGGRAWSISPVRRSLVVCIHALVRLHLMLRPGAGRCCAPAVQQPELCALALFWGSRKLAVWYSALFPLHDESPTSWQLSAADVCFSADTWAQPCTSQDEGSSVCISTLPSYSPCQRVTLTQTPKCALSRHIGSCSNTWTCPKCDIHASMG